MLFAAAMGLWRAPVYSAVHTVPLSAAVGVGETPFCSDVLAVLPSMAAGLGRDSLLALL